MSAKISINSSVSIQKGAVVSKEIFNKSSGTITLFAFDAGQGLSEHSAPFDAIIEVTDGSATVTLDGVAHDLYKGDLLVMPANSKHAIKAKAELKMLLIMMRS